MFKATKQSGDTLDYDVDFSQWLPKGDLITTASAVLNVTGELVIDAVSLATPIVKVWLSAGVNGSTYKITVTIATNGGRVKEEEFLLRIKDI